jgi:hypothetical protein
LHLEMVRMDFCSEFQEQFFALNVEFPVLKSYAVCPASGAIDGTNQHVSFLGIILDKMNSPRSKLRGSSFRKQVRRGRFMAQKGGN